MKDTSIEKADFRKKIAALKKTFTLEELRRRSEEALSVLEITGVFQEAKNIFIYNNLADEVQTTYFIRRWSDTKNFYLPVVDDDDIVFRAYSPSMSYNKSSYGIEEPLGENFIAYNKVDLVVVPGLAFDRKMNRLGRGKGFYDRFLENIVAPKVGICFDFQLFDKIPSHTHDIQMDYIVSENELIWK